MGGFTVRQRRGLIVLLILVVVSCVGYGILRYHNRHLSSELKRTLIASLDSSASEDDIHAYLREARLQVRTRKDAEVLQKFETAVEFAEKSAERHASFSEDMEKGFSDQSEGFRLQSRYASLMLECGRSHCADSSTLHAQMVNARKEEQASEDQTKLDSEAMGNDTKYAEEYRLLSVKLLNEVRENVGVAPRQEAKP